MKRPELKTELRVFASEVVVYGVFVFGYLWAVHRYLGAWLDHLFEGRRIVYAVVALFLVMAQGILLEQLTHVLVQWIMPKRLRRQNRHT
ncbi:MAG TPA: hypothetical protein VG936_18550 [Lacunisphaera sp.]|nr:hypothetical protein [Lacunisphaera sp.]